MKNNILKFSFVIFCVLISCVLFGCKNDKIKFYRESKVQELMHGFQDNNPKKDSIQKSSGIIIYRDNSAQNSTNQSINFGPKDLNFDLKIK